MSKVNEFFDKNVVKQLEDIQKALGVTNKQLNDLGNTKVEFPNVKKIAEELNTLSNSTEGFSKKEKELNAIRKKTITVLAKTSAERTKEGELLANATEARRKQNTQIKEEIKLSKASKDSIVALNAANKKLREQRNGLSTSTKKGVAQIKALNRQIDKNTKLIQKNSDKMGKQKMNIGNYASALKGLAAGFGIGSAIAIFTKIMGSAVKTVMTFSKASSNLAAVLGLTKDETQALTDNALKLGAATQYTAAQVTDLQTEYAKLGFTEEQILNLTGATLNLATAAGTDLANAATVVGGTLNAFGLDADQATRLTDVMAKSFSTSALDIEKFKTSMATVAPVAKAAGVSLERATASVAALADTNIDASTSGAALRNIYLDLADKGITYEEAMTKINTSTNKLSTANELFGKRGATVALVLAENELKINSLTESFENAEGAAMSMAEVMEDNLQGDLAKLNSAWEGLILSFEDGNGAFSELSRTIVTGLTDALGSVQKFGKDAVEWFNKMMVESAAFRVGLVLMGATMRFSFANMKLILKLFWAQLSFIGRNIAAVWDGDFDKIKENIKLRASEQTAALKEYGQSVKAIAVDVAEAASEEAGAEALRNQELKKQTAAIQKQAKEREIASKARMEAAKEESKIEKEKEKDNKQAAKDREKLINDNIKAELAAVKMKNKEEIIDNKNLFATQVLNQEEYNEASKQLEFDLIDDKIAVLEKYKKEGKLSATQLAKIESDISNLRLSKEKKTVDEKLKLNQDATKDQEALVKATADALLRQKDREYQIRLEAARKASKNDEEYQQKVAEINREILQDTIDSLQAQIDAADISAIDKIKLKEDLADKELELNRLTNDEIIRQDEETAEKKKAILDGVFQIASALSDAVFSRNEANRELELEAQETQFATDQENLELAHESGALTDEAYATQKAALDAKQDEESKKLLLDQAKRKRNDALFQIGIDTILAGTKTAANLGFPAAIPALIAVAASGAAAAIAVAAKPLPAFEKGTKSAPGGLAIVSEKGSELAIEPSGDMYLTPSSEAIMDIKAGTEIVPVHKTVDRLHKELQYSPEGTKSNDDLTMLLAATNRVERAIKNQPVGSGLTKDGINTTITKGHRQTTYINRRFRHLG